ncbi:MAG TPA: DUF6754 domain-containing protein [Chloroflexia bacterium]|nr:DUF6754 domain-containing protein [Chloroflexia bacterium]
MDIFGIQAKFGDTFFFMLGALLLFLVLFLVYLWLSGWGRGPARRRFHLRRIEAYEATSEGLARAAETGRAVHTSPGTGGVGAEGVTTASTLAGMGVVESMARTAAITGAPVQATTNDAVAFALTENALRRGYRRAGWSMESESGAARFLTHRDALAYVAGASEIVASHKVSHAVMSGQFGAEVLLLTEAQRRSGAHQVVGSTVPQGAALVTLTADQALVGEEVFASGAYLERRTTHIASLLAQDGLRWIVILAIIAGFVLVNVFGVSWTQVFSTTP